MSVTWTSDSPPPVEPITFRGWLRILRRGVPFGIVVGLGLILTQILRLIEAPLFGQRRPITPYITRAVCMAVFPIIGMGFRMNGQPAKGRVAVVANHASWLDIFALNARQRIYFVSKSEVAAWPCIGWLARATGTVFISRDRKDAKRQSEIFSWRLSHGHRLLFFPEGTSTDSLRVLPFKTTLFQPFFAHDLRSILKVQPVSLHYFAPSGKDPRFYGWWGDMDFGSHLLQVLAAPRQGRIEVTYHPAVSVKDFDDRKALARHCEETVRRAF